MAAKLRHKHFFEKRLCRGVGIRHVNWVFMLIAVELVTAERVECAAVLKIRRFVESLRGLLIKSV